MKIEGSDLHEGQQQVVEMILGDAQCNVCIAPRQTGKSYLSQQVVLYWAINHPKANVFWIAPTYQQCMRPFEEIYDGIFLSGALKSANKSELRLTFQNGSVIHFKSIERAANLRGFTATHMLCDEAAYYPENVWAEVLRPITLVHKAKTLFVSTPRGHNWLKTMYDMGQSSEHPNYASCRMHYHQNPFIDLAEIEEARATLPEHIYAAEYEGSFVESGQTVFSNLKACSFERWPSSSGRNYMGVDLGRRADWTVATVVDSDGKVLEIYRDNKKDWAAMIGEIVKLAKKWNAHVLVESNSIGDVVEESIRREWPKTEGFATTSQSKQKIIEALIVAFNTESIRIPSKELFEPLLFELEIFEYQYSRASRSVQYQSPAPFHDDCVMSLAIAWEARERMKASGQYVYPSSSRRY